MDKRDYIDKDALTSNDEIEILKRLIKDFPDAPNTVKNYVDISDKNNQYRNELKEYIKNIDHFLGILKKDDSVDRLRTFENIRNLEEYIKYLDNLKNNIKTDLIQFLVSLLPYSNNTNELKKQFYNNLDTIGKFLNYNNIENDIKKSKEYFEGIYNIVYNINKNQITNKLFVDNNYIKYIKDGIKYLNNTYFILKFMKKYQNSDLDSTIESIEELNNNIDSIDTTIVRMIINLVPDFSNDIKNLETLIKYNESLDNILANIMTKYIIKSYIQSISSNKKDEIEYNKLFDTIIKIKSIVEFTGYLKIIDNILNKTKKYINDSKNILKSSSKFYETRWWSIIYNIGAILKVIRTGQILDNYDMIKDAIKDLKKYKKDLMDIKYKIENELNSYRSENIENLEDDLYYILNSIGKGSIPNFDNIINKMEIEMKYILVQTIDSVIDKLNRYV